MPVNENKMKESAASGCSHAVNIGVMVIDIFNLTGFFFFNGAP